MLSRFPTNWSSSCQNDTFCHVARSSFPCRIITRLSCLNNRRISATSAASTAIRVSCVISMPIRPESPSNHSTRTGRNMPFLVAYTTLLARNPILDYARLTPSPRWRLRMRRPSGPSAPSLPVPAMALSSTSCSTEYSNDLAPKFLPPCPRRDLPSSPRSS
ncbi:hypothetical protein LZ30DRAFT_127599 [Colletotrichum cereale]|nr:hypothetical protein LZ30DRAFT_127599 [Colletotrichum cereale]